MPVAAMPWTNPAARRRHGTDDRSPWESLPPRIALLRANPEVVPLAGGAARQSFLCSPAAFLDLDAEVGERQQVCGRAENELGEVGRPGALERVERLVDLERVPDGAAERLVHVGQLADHLPAVEPAELDHGPRQLPCLVEASS